MNERDNAPPPTRSKRGSPKQTDRFDPAWEGQSDSETKRAHGETPGPTEAQKALETEAQEALDDRIKAMFQEKSTGAFEVHGDPYQLAKDPQNGV